jgi:uncharacterized membrane protein
MPIGRTLTARTLTAGFALLALAGFVLLPATTQASGSGAPRPALHNPNVTRVLVQSRLRHVREAARKAAEEARRKRPAGPADGSAAEPKIGR